MPKTIDISKRDSYKCLLYYEGNKIEYKPLETHLGRRDLRCICENRKQRVITEVIDETKIPNDASYAIKSFVESISTYNKTKTLFRHYREGGAE